MNALSKKFHRGFTLMEVMVAVSIFAIIVTVGIVALLTINDAYRKSEAQRQTNDSLAYILESMSRRIRTAQSWITTAGPNQTSFSFKDQDNITVTYTWDQVNNEITMGIANPTPCTGTCPPNVPDSATQPNGVYNLTPTNVFIAANDGTNPIPGGGLTFNVFGGSGAQSYVQINLGGYSTEGRQSSDFAFQTGISKRVLDVPNTTP